MQFISKKQFVATFAVVVLMGATAQHASAQADRRDAKMAAAKGTAGANVDSDGDGVMDDKDGCPKVKGDTACMGCPNRGSVDLVKLPEFVSAPEPVAAAAPAKGKKGKGKPKAAAAYAEPTFDEQFKKSLDDILAAAQGNFIAEKGAVIGKEGSGMFESSLTLPQSAKTDISAKAAPSVHQSYFAQNAAVTKEAAEVTYLRLESILRDSYKDATFEERPNKRMIKQLIMKTATGEEAQLIWANTNFGSLQDKRKHDIVLKVSKPIAGGAATPVKTGK